MWRIIFRAGDDLNWTVVSRGQDVDEIGRQVTNILNSRRVRAGEFWRACLWQALVDEIRASIARRL